MDTTVFEHHESSVRSYCRHFPAVFDKAKGSLLFDETGNAYIDFFCGAGALNYGHNTPYIKEKVMAYLERDGILHSMDMYTCAKREFLTTLQERILKPRGFDYKVMFCGPTGTNAIEASLKLARRITGRTNVFAFMGCFHGMTLGSLALTTEAYARKAAGVPLTNCTHIPTPYMFPDMDIIDYMQRLIDDDHSGVDKPAALVMETVQAEGGIYPFSDTFLQDCRKFCDKNDILLIVDDIQAGCCRSGTFFSFERADIKPDIVVMSKSIGGIGMPMSILLISPQEDIWKPAEHNGTFRGNQLSFIAGNAALSYMLDNQIEKGVKEKESILCDYIENHILPIDSRLSYRGIGLIGGIDCSAIGDSQLTKQIITECFHNKLILERAGRNDSVLKLMPPLNIENNLLIGGLERLRSAIIKVLGKEHVNYA